MTTESLGERAEGANGADIPMKVGLLSEISRMGSVIWRSRERKQLLLLGVALIAVVASTAYMQTRLNAWNQPFYDALTRKDLSAFLRQLGVSPYWPPYCWCSTSARCGSIRPPESPCVRVWCMTCSTSG